MNKKVKEEKNVLVFDLGGGKLNVSVITVDDDLLEIKSTAGDFNIGGEDITNRLLEWCASEFK